MAQTKNALKNIVCLESLWNDDVEARLSMHPVLDVIAKSYGVKVTYLSCNTHEEFEFNLKMIRRRRNAGVLYLAFHGASDCISLPDGNTLSFDKLAELMGQRFKNWVVHFGSCSTCNVDGNRLREFRQQTGVAAVTGYTENIDWIDAAALDMIVLRWLQEYKDMSAMRRRIEKDYTGLVERLGFVSSP